MFSFKHLSSHDRSVKNTAHIWPQRPSQIWQSWRCRSTQQTCQGSHCGGETPLQQQVPYKLFNQCTCIMWGSIDQTIPATKSQGGRSLERVFLILIWVRIQFVSLYPYETRMSQNWLILEGTLPSAQFRKSLLSWLTGITHLGRNMVSTGRRRLCCYHSYASCTFKSFLPSLLSPGVSTDVHPRKPKETTWITRYQWYLKIPYSDTKRFTVINCPVVYT